MTPRVLFLMLAGLGTSFAGCFPVAGDRILARDLALAVPAFAKLPPNLELGFAPASGARRTYSAAEVARLAHRYGLDAEPGAEACFARPVETLTRERVAAALQAALPAARIDVVEWSPQPVPPGELRFPPSGLAVPEVSAPQTPLLWRGAICRPGSEDFPVWAKARIQVTGVRVVAAETLLPGRRIEPAQLRLEPYVGPPGPPGLAQIVGRASQRLIPAGARIDTQFLEEPEEVFRGERVRVEVRSGQARLLLEGLAQASGRRGETIPVRNPASGRIFSATVQNRGQVTVVAGWSVPRGESQ
jgi:flagella basal body P-ring formation protein FlgA